MQIEDSVVHQSGDYGGVYADIERFTGNRVIGVEFWRKLPHDRHDLDWHVRADWPGEEGGRSNQWSNMRNSDSGATPELAFDSRCIAAQMISTYSCFRMLSDAYNRALDHHYPDGERARFSSTKTFEILSTSQLFLYNLTSCLDFIFRFASRHILNLGSNYDNYARSLDKILDANLIDSTISIELNRIYNLRNLEMHNVPFTNISTFGAHIYPKSIKDILYLDVKIPSPDINPKSFREKLSLLNTFQEWKDFMATQTTFVDLLEFADHSLQILVSISDASMARSPATPRILTFTDAEIVAHVTKD